MEKIDIKEVEEIVNQMDIDNKVQFDLFRKIDEAVNCSFTPDKAVSELPYIKGRHFAATDVADARNAGTRTFSSLLPDISISPVMDNQGEYDRVEKLEQAWKWEMERMSRPVNGKKGFHDAIVESAITYHKIAFQTEYLPYKYKGNTDPRIKSLLMRKCFNWTVHHPGTVTALYSDYGLERVRKKGDFTAQQIVDNFGKGNPGVAKFLSENVSYNRSDLLRVKFTLHDYTDWKHRVIYLSSEGSNSPKYELMNEKHGLPFIPWVVVDYGNPLWQSILDSGLWNNLQHMLLMQFSKAVATGMRSDLVIETPDGKLSNVWIDYQNPLNPIVIPSGSRITPLPSNNLDQAFVTQLGNMSDNVSRSTVARILQDTSQYSNSPFSSLNAAITTALGQLSPAKRIAETAESEGIFQGFQWIKHSKIPFVGYRNKSSDPKIEGDKPYMQGSPIYITHEDVPSQSEMEKMTPQEINLHSQKTFFDLESLYINVELKSANVVDEQAKLNMLINARREFGMSQKEAWERMDWDGFEMNQTQRASETLFDAELNKAVQMKMAEVQMQQQQAQMQMQQQAQQEQQAQIQQQQQMMSQQTAVNDMSAASQFAGMEGVDMRTGGMPAAMQAPNATREAITGQTMGGDQIPV